LAEGYRQIRYTSAAVERFFAEGQRLIKNRLLPILHNRNIFLSDLGGSAVKPAAIEIYTF